MNDQQMQTGAAVPAASVDALLPAAMAEKLEDVGLKKATMDPLSLFMLAVLAGAFIALGAVLYTVAVTGTANFLGFGAKQILGGLVFCLGLILVVVSGAELFTGNNLIIMAAMSGKVRIGQLLYNWGIVFAGNFAGAFLTAWLVVMAEQFRMGDGAFGALIGATALAIGEAKCDLTFTAAFFRGILCNALVCLAVWMCLSARSVTDKVMVILPPITAFVACGFEHSVANMYFVPLSLLLQAKLANAPADGAVAILQTQAATLSHLGWGAFLAKNLLPVTLGNIVGGSGLVGAVYWLIYRRNRMAAD